MTKYNYKSFLIGILVITSLFLSSCYYDVEEVLYGTEDCNTDNVSFKNDIMPLLNSRCIICHASGSSIGAGIVLDNHADVLAYVKSGSLLGSVKWDAGFSSMPKGSGKLSNCAINKIDFWIKAGALDN